MCSVVWNKVYTGESLPQTDTHAHADWLKNTFQREYQGVINVRKESIDTLEGCEGVSPTMEISDKAFILSESNPADSLTKVVKKKWLYRAILL